MKKLPAENVPVLERPSRATILKTIGIVLAVALVLLTLVVLPAEYGIDVTGLGGRLGLTRLSQNDPGVTATNVSVHSAQADAYRTNQVELTLAPDEGLEYKFSLDQGAAMVYSWQADGLLYYDFHGEPEGDTSGYFESYSAAINTELEVNGSFTAPFRGRHGWYWENRGDGPVTLTLSTAGYYEVLGVP
jgi:hypothetical protein